VVLVIYGVSDVPFFSTTVKEYYKLNRMQYMFMCRLKFEVLLLCTFLTHYFSRHRV
jgi:hypothetical protein